MYEPVLTDEKLDLYNVYEVHKNYRILAMAVNVPLQVAEEICHILNEFEIKSLQPCPICDQSVTINEYISDYLYSINCECCGLKTTAIVKFSGIYKWDIINPLKDCLKNGKPIKNEQLGYECNVFDLFIHDATKAFVNAEFKLKIGVILPVTEEQFIEANKNIKEIVNTDDAIINCGAYGKGRIYHLEYTKLADSERGRL